MSSSSSSGSCAIANRTLGGRVLRASSDSKSVLHDGHVDPVHSTSPKHDPWDCHIFAYIEVVWGVNVGIYSTHGVVWELYHGPVLTTKRQFSNTKISKSGSARASSISVVTSGCQSWASPGKDIRRQLLFGLEAKVQRYQ